MDLVGWHKPKQTGTSEIIGSLFVSEVFETDCSALEFCYAVSFKDSSFVLICDVVS
jgi:hypothetical protein